jgi:hypothetical protein
MALFGRYYSQRDINLVNQFNAELMRDIIETLVVLFKIAPNETNTNIYGEAVAAEGKSFYSGVELSSLIDRGDISTDDEGFGPDRDQTVVFKFRELSLKDASFYPEVGDLILFNDRYHEVDNVVQEQLLGGQANKSHSIICNTHYSKLSKINLVNRQY